MTLNFNQDNTSFIKQINKTFSKYKLDKPKLIQDCANQDGKFKLSLPQQFISEYYTPKNPNGLLLYLSIGAGKTLAAVNLIKHFISYKANVIWVTRTTLKKDLDKALTLLPIPGVLTRFSYKQFSNIAKRKGENYKKLMEKAHKLNPKTNDPLYRTLVIIDEAHKLYTKDLKIQELHDINAIQKMVYDSYSDSGINRARLVLMSATPITENPEEILHLFNLIITNPKERIDIEKLKKDYIHSDGRFTSKGKEYFIEKIKGLVSYLDTSKDPSKFAQVRYNEVLVPISEKPDVPTAEDYCNKHYKICLDNENDKRDCIDNKTKCKELIKNNALLISKNKYQIDILKDKCSITF